MLYDYLAGFPTLTMSPQPNGCYSVSVRDLKNPAVVTTQVVSWHDFWLGSTILDGVPQEPLIYRMLRSNFVLSSTVPPTRR